VHANDVTVNAVQKIIKNSNHSYVCNVLHIKLVKLQSIWKSGSCFSRICYSKSGKIRLRPDWKKIRYSPTTHILDKSYPSQTEENFPTITVDY